MTKVEKFEAIIEVLNEAGADAELIEAMETEKAANIRKAEKAQERAAAKKEAGDALRATIEGILSDEPMSIDDIVEAIGDESITAGKVRSRVSALVSLGKAEKKSMNMKYTDENGKEKSKRVMTYTLA